MTNTATESPDAINGAGTSRLPAGMTQQEADRLIAEAANRTKDTPR